MKLTGRSIEVPVVNDSDWQEPFQHPTHYLALHLDDELFVDWQDMLAGLGVVDTHLWLGHDVADMACNELKT